MRLAEETYGKVTPRGARPERVRPAEPPTVADRLVTVRDEKVQQPNWQRHYLVPSCRTAGPGESEALDVLGHLIGGGQTSLLYRELVMEQKLAVSAWAYYHGTALDQSRFIANATPAPGVALEAIDKAFDRVLAKFLVEGVDEAALERAKTRLVADAIYARDSQSDLARWYGSSLALGQTIARSRGLAVEDRGGRRRRRARRRPQMARPQARRHRTSPAARRRGRLNRPGPTPFSETPHAKTRRRLVA